MHSRGDRQESGSRGQSETLGFVLVFSLLIIGALVVVGLGATAIGDTEQQLEDDRAQKTLTQFDSKAGLVALEEADSQRVSLPTDGDGQYFVRNESDWMSVVIENRSTENSQEVLNTTLGAVTYENGDTTLAYQGGGVWRKTENGGRMVSPPEFHYRNGTLTLPIVKVSGEPSVENNAVIKQNGTTKEFPTTSGLANETNPLEQFEVSVVVQSDFYRGWGNYFEERTDGEVEYIDSKNRVVLDLVAPADFPPVEAGLFSGTTGTLEVRNTAVSSYDSDTGTFSTGVSKVAVLGDLYLRNGATVYGDLEVGGSITAQNNALVDDGDIIYGGSTAFSSCATESRWINCLDNIQKDNASVVEPPIVDRVIEERLDTFQGDNDNAAEDDISSNQISCSGADCELDPGNYYLDDLTLLSDDLTLNTTDGEINIAVDNDVYLDNNRLLAVDGPDRVNIYVNKTFEGAQNFKAGNFSSPDKPSTQFWLYLRSDGAATIQNGGEYVGVIYGPGGALGPGADIDVSGSSSGCGGCQIYGGMLGDITSQVNNAFLFFDEALLETETVTAEAGIIRVTYLHITTNEIRVES